MTNKHELDSSLDLPESGKWVQLLPGSEGLHCAMCNRSLSSPAWQATILADSYLFCNPDHTALFYNYLQPLYE